jgi:hypothetical protein
MKILAQPCRGDALFIIRTNIKILALNQLLVKDAGTGFVCPMNLKTKKKRRKYFTMKHKKLLRTEIINRILFLKKMNVVDGSGNVLVDKKYFPENSRWFNCYSCQYNKIDEHPFKCLYFKSIDIKLTGIKKGRHAPGERYWVCLGHEWPKRVIAKIKQGLTNR